MDENDILIQQNVVDVFQKNFFDLDFEFLEKEEESKNSSNFSSKMSRTKIIIFYF